MILVKTPLRISFIGGGTDFQEFYSKNGGAVISTTIDKSVYVAINPKFDGDIRVSYSHTEIVSTSKDVQHTRVRAVLEKMRIEKGLEIVTISDLPSEGTGLGSSSALTVGLLHGLGSKNIAEEACKIEINTLREPIGKQDQYACAFGGLNLITFTKNSVEVRPIILDPVIKEKLQNYLMFFYTGKTRQASVILKKQKENQKTNMLRKICDLVPVFHTMLKEGDFKGMGALLDEAWALKKNLADGITDNEIDRMYNLALRAGAWGGKILGAGGGGFLMLMVEPEKQEAVATVLASYRQVKFKFSDKGSEIVYHTT